MLIRLLGPVDIVDEADVRVPAGLRRLAVLAALALTPGTVVGIDRLIDAVWPHDPPATALNTLQSHVSYLRRLLGDPDALRARPPGYVLVVDTDARRAARLVQEATSLDDPHARTERLEAALALWRGPSLADLAGQPWFDAQARRLDDLRLRARQDLAAAQLTTGRHHDAVGDLQALGRENPLHEPVHELLMLALYQDGRQADALTVFQDLRLRLEEELGIDPGPALSDRYAAILRQDPDLDQRTKDAPVPAQLPAAVTGFAGRHAELDRLDALLGIPGPVVITAIGGSGGIGKTALAVHWAHRATPHFPDGQLYVDLRGFAPAGTPVDPSDALSGFLTALGTPPGQIPAGAEARSALYRTAVAGRRILVLLDNARDATQVRPLLPGAPGCLALVTSRHQLTPLVVAEGARPLPLDVLPAADAHDLFARRIGADRVAAEPDAAADVVTRCAGLPLALALAAARAAMQTGRPLASIAADLGTATLTSLDGGDPDTDLRAVFSWSYRTLDEPAARTFRLLGLRDGPTVSAAAVASLTGRPPADVARDLTELTRASLLTETAPGRFGTHDLLSRYARERTHAEDPPVERHAAIGRLVDHYVQSAYFAAARLDPAQPTSAPPPAPRSGVHAEPCADLDAALAWFDAEHAALVAIVAQAAAEGFHDHAWRLATMIGLYLDRRGHWTDLAQVTTTGIDSARQTPDDAGEAFCLRSRAVAMLRLDRRDDAEADIRAALALSTRTGDRNGEARAHLTLAWLSENSGRNRDAIDHAKAALDRYRDTDEPAGQARALASLAWNHLELGDNDAADGRYAEALALHHASGDTDGEAVTLEGLSVLHTRTGEHAQAADCLRRAAELHDQLGHRLRQALARDSLGDSLGAIGDHSGAYNEWRRAWEILEELHVADAVAVAAKLRAGDAVPSDLDL